MASINSPIQNMRNLDRGNVYGTFPGGNISYDPSVFERERVDGTTIIDLVPDCRVFVFGAEITKDVKDVSIKHGLKGSSCTISLASPRGKYEIHKSDLSGKWREDKDILATYEYDRFDRQKKMSPDVLKMLTSNDQYNKIRGYQQTFFRGAGSNTPSPSNVTRMAFETKFFSGIEKQVGDMIFDFRDPVMIFLKGRFSPYWYFAFTGVLVKWDDNDTYGQEQTISLFAEDLFYLWKRQKFTKQGSIMRAGNLESSTRNINKKQMFNIYKNVLAKEGTTLDQAVKILAFGGDYASKVQNCYPLYTKNRSVNLRETDLSKLKGVVSAIRNFLNIDYSIGGIETKYALDDKSFMLTWGSNPDRTDPDSQTGTGLFSPEPAKSNMINLIQIKSGIQNKKLNSWPFSEWLTLYPQLNTITINDYEDAKELQYKYMASVRFWEVNPKIDITNNKEKTGWSDNGGLVGVCGTHPALTHDFIDHFDMLGKVWADCYKYATKDDSGSSPLDKLNVSPHEKIREIVSGSPTENRNDFENERGTNLNLFRPRLFVIKPQKFEEQNRGIMATALGQLSLQKETATDTHKALIEVLDSIEFTTYCSSMGDIFIEPEMYDFHPQDFLVSQDRNVDGKIEERSPIHKKTAIEFRALMDKDDPETKQVRTDSAFMFNTKANHPFFLNEKDRIRCTQSFKPENIKTHVEVIPSMYKGGGIIAGMLQSFMEQNMTVFQSDKYDGSSEGNLKIARYIADGFGYRISRKNLTVHKEHTEQQIKDLKDEYTKVLMSELFENYKNTKFEEFLIEATSAMEQIVTYEDYKKHGWGVEDGTVEEINRIFEIVLVAQDGGSPLRQVDNDYGFTQLEYTGIRIANYTVPLILALMGMTNSKTKNTELQRLRKSYKFGKLKDSIGLSPTSIIGNWFGLKDFANSYTAYTKIGVPERVSTSSPPAITIGQDVMEDVQKELLKLYEAIAINGLSSKAKELYEQIYTLKSSRAIKLPSMLNLSDLKKLEDIGVYNPRTDMTRRYGYNPGPVIKNMMVNSGGEAQRYAVTKFNQLYGKAHIIHMDVIGRPELFLNRPYYCERKDAIGLLENFTLNFNVGSDFQTSLDLTYIRKNSLTYGYTMGGLDILVGKKNNSYFKKAAEAYYESLSSMNQKLSNAVQNKYSEVGGWAFAAAGSKLGAGATGQKYSGLLGEKAFKLGGSGFAGAIYSAHDWIGHLEYDKIGKINNIKNSEISGMIADPQLKLLVSSPEDAQTFIMGVRLTCLNLRRELEELSDIEIVVDKEFEERKVTLEELDTAETERRNSIESKSDSIKISLYNRDIEVLNSKIKIIDNNLNQYQLLHLEKAKIIYGIDSQYNVGYSYDSTKPMGTRTPDITSLHDATEYMKKANSTALFYKLVNEIMSFNVELANIQLLDDRTIGTFKQGFDTSFIHKIGYTGKVPFYAFIASGGGSSDASTTSAGSV